MHVTHDTYITYIHMHNLAFGRPIPPEIYLGVYTLAEVQA